MSPNTIRKALEKLAVRDEDPDAPVESGLRRKGTGRKKRTHADPQLLDALEKLVKPTIGMKNLLLFSGLAGSS